jgi:glucan-binding YG repeat protein
LKHYQKYLESGDDQTIIPTPAMTDDVRKVVTILQQPETRRDMWELIGLVEELFRKRTGLTLTAYGLNENGTQSRSAEETLAKHRAVGVRPEFMQKMIVDWQSRAAASEAMVARRFIRSPHVAARIGPTMADWWDRVVASDDDEAIARQYEYTVDAASIRRPNRDRDIGNFQQVMQYWLSVISQYSAASGNYEPVNALMKKWGDLHDQDMSEAFIPDMSDQMEAMQQQQQQMAEQEMQMEQAKVQADLQGKQMDAESKQLEMQTKLLDAQIKQETAQADLARKAAETQLDAAARQQEMEFDARKAELDIQLESGKGLAQILMERQRHQQKMQQDAQQGAIKTITAVQGAKVQADLAKQKAKTQTEVMRAKAKQQKRMAMQKPKPQGGKR